MQAVCVSPDALNMPPPSGVNNIFSLLDEDDNEADDGFTVVPAKAAKPAKVEEHAKTQPPRERKSKPERPPRGKGDKRREERDYDGSDKPEKPEGGENRKGGKGERRERGEGKGDRKGSGRKGSGRREFDRHSGTGRGKGEPREGRGKFNWGEKADGAEQTAEGDAETENKPPRRERAERRDDNGAAPAPAEEEEEEENTMTFEEYMKAQADKNKVGPVLNERVVENSGEGFLFSRGEADGHEDVMYGMAFHDYDGKEKHHEDKEAREGWVDADSVFNLKFVDPNSGKGDDRRGKGGKKGGKGARDDRSGRGPRQAPPARPQQQQQQGKIELDDTSAFPSLV